MNVTRSLITRSLAAVYLLVFFVLALFDVPLRPDVAEFLKVPASPVSEAENGYFAMIGFSAPAGADIHAFGKKKYLQALHEGERNRARKTLKPPVQEAADKELAFQGKELPKDRFYQFAQNTAPVVDRMARDNAELLSRYRSLRTYKQIHEPDGNGHHQDIPIPSFGPIRSTQALTLLLIISQAQQGNPDGALASLAEDLAYWRGALQQGHTLIGKLIAIAAIQRDYLVLSELIAHHPLSAVQHARIRTLLPAWKADDIRMGEAFRYEALFLCDTLHTSLTSLGPAGRIFLKKNATQNAMVPFHMENERLSGLSADAYYRSLGSQERLQKEQARLHPDFLYNPVGAILNSIAVPQFSSYFSRFHDLEAKRRMVLIQLMAREKGVTYDGMPAFLKQSGQDYANPYTNQPMQWDAKKNAIVMDSIPAVGKAEQRRVELAL